MEESVFSQIVSKKIPAHVVYEDDLVIAFLDIKPIHPGHTIVIPKQHSRDIFDISKDDWQHTAEVVRKLATSIKTAVKADGINLIMNNGTAAGQTEFWPHVHIIPRFQGDGISVMPQRISSYEEMMHTQEHIIKAIKLESGKAA
jgi:histidine triad (HIT) family protein